jgi:hypothetical protein
MKVCVFGAGRNAIAGRLLFAADADADADADAAADATCGRGQTSLPVSPSAVAPRAMAA